MSIIEDCLVGRWQVNAQRFVEILSQGGLAAEPADGSWDLVVNDDFTFVSTLVQFALTDARGDSGPAARCGASSLRTMTGGGESPDAIELAGAEVRRRGDE